MATDYGGFLHPDIEGDADPNFRFGNFDPDVDLPVLSICIRHWMICEAKKEGNCNPAVIYVIPHCSMF